MDPEQFRLAADGAAPGSTRLAAAAGPEGLDGDALSELQPRRRLARAERVDRAHHLVAGDPAGREPADSEQVEIAAADPAGFDPHAHLCGRGLGRRERVDLDPTRAARDGRLHGGV